MTAPITRAIASVAFVIILGLTIALLMTRATLFDTKRERDLAVAKFAVSNASIEALSNEMAGMLATQQALANGDANRISASRQAVELADAASAARQVMIDRLRLSAGMERPAEAACEVSETVKEVWP